jgi:GYF domain 2
MPYTVSRNGQTYGPYTLEDLQRYVASGNILPSDMAKSDDMPDWLPVAQILGTPAAPPAFVPPASTAYPPPTGAIYPDPPNFNWGLELLLGFFTLGLFVVFWNFVIASWAKRVQPASKALMYYIIGTVLAFINFGGSFGILIALGHHEHPHQSVFSSLIGIASWVVRLIARFTLRDDIEQHFNGPEPLGIRLSGVLTFFFGGIYFQYKLNQINDLKRTLRYQNAIR